MVFYFVDNAVSPPAKFFVGEDKYENEELIRWGWPEDVWFHVDKLSSAHVYLRLKPGQTLDNVPKEVIESACQLCKANSITGCKMDNVDVIYTMWSNLKKTPGMDFGQVAFHKDNEVRKFRVEKKKGEIINRLKKTKTEDHPNFRDLREERDAEERRKKKQQLKEEEAKRKVDEENRKKEAELKSYTSLMKDENMVSNYELSGYDSDDFM